MTEEEKIKAEFKDTKNKIEKLEKKQAKGKELTNAELRNMSVYKSRLKYLEDQLAGGATTATPNDNANKPAQPKQAQPKQAQPKPAQPKNNNNTQQPNTKQPNTNTPSILLNSEQKAQEAADAMNEGNEKKVEDAGSATKTAKDMANTVDANIEENVPTWFWREAREMAPTDKAKRGFLISDYITNRLGTALSNTGAIVQNNGGSGGGQIKAQGGTYIDQYRQSKLEQALANRKAKQDSLMQAQNDILTAIFGSENEVRAIQNKLRNSKNWNKYNRLTNEQQVYIKGLLYSDTRGKISDAVLGNLINKLLTGEDISLNELTSTVLVSAGIDDAKQITNGAKNILNKAMDAAGKVGEWGEGWLKNYKKAGE